LLSLVVVGVEDFMVVAVALAGSAQAQAYQ
jgi:hypothetical protein